jgi:peroxidase
LPNQGDDRVNEQSVLAVIHTLWLREHNRIESELHRINPAWSGRTLYDETRRIVGAMMQQITYAEFLPVVLGPATIKRYELDLLSGTEYYNGWFLGRPLSGKALGY